MADARCPARPKPNRVPTRPDGRASREVRRSHLTRRTAEPTICSQTGNALSYKLRVMARSSITRFAASLSGRKSQPSVKAALDAWFHEVRLASWRSSADVKRSYATASIVSSDRVVFNIKGNDFRLIAAVDYRRQVVYIKWIGSHGDYDSIDAKTVQYED
jgi:mRNA interferase HigB